MKHTVLRKAMALLLAFTMLAGMALPAFAEGSDAGSLPTETPTSEIPVEPEESPAPEESPLPEESPVPEATPATEEDTALPPESASEEEPTPEESPAVDNTVPAPAALSTVLDAVPEGAVEISREGASVVASSNREDLPVANVLDGDTGTIYHSAPNENPPFDLTLSLAEKQMVSHIKITGRIASGNSLNGYPKALEVYAGDSADACNTLVATVDNLPGGTPSSGLVRVIVLDTPVQTQYLRLHFTDSVIFDSPYKPVAIAELQLYNLDPMQAAKTALEEALEEARTLLERLWDETAKANLTAAIQTAEQALAQAESEQALKDAEAALRSAIEAAAESLIVRTEITSPDGSLVLTFWLDENGTPWYQASRNGKALVEPSSLGMTLSANDGGQMTGGFTLLDTETVDVNTSWEPATAYTQSEIPDVYQQTTFKLEDAQKRRLDIVFRAYDEGFGFRYEFPNEGALAGDPFIIEQERTQFAIPQGTRTHAHGTHSQSIPSDTTVEKLSGQQYTPITFEYTDGNYGALFESNLFDYARLKLDCSNGVLTSNVKWGNATIEGTYTEDKPFFTPWRGMMVADSLGGLQEHNYLVMNLSEPCTMEDTSWIVTGQMLREAKLTEENTQKCIDFAAANNIEYVLYDSGWYGTENDPNMSPMKPVIGEFPYMVGWSQMRSCYVDVSTVAERWADEKGVGVILYINHLHMEKYDLEEVFAKWEEWGIKGVKFGFVNVGNQYWTRWLHDAIDTAARHHLAVVIHDEYIPSGLERAYPNILNVEGVLGDEGSPNYSADLKQVFTRTLIGPSDHTFCYPVNEYRGAIKTNAYSLASPILYYGGLSSPYWYGNPDVYSSGDYPELKFWNDMPGEWDESRHIDSSFGEYFTMARRSGEEWFLGSLSAVERTLTMTPDYLKPDTAYVAEVYTNSPGDTLQNNKVAISKYIVYSDTQLTFSMIVGGGLGIRFVPATAEEIESIPVYSPYREALIQTLGMADGLDLNEYTTRTVAESRIETVREEARALLDNMQASDEELQAARAALEEAMGKLVKKTHYAEVLDRSGWTVRASTERPGTHEAKFAIDGNLDKMWHTAAGVKPPHWFEVDLGEKTAVDVIEITGRRDGGSGYNGFPLVIEVMASDDGETYHKVTDVNWSGESVGAGHVKQIVLPEGTEARYLRLTITKGHGDANVASMAELNMYASPFGTLKDLIQQAQEKLDRLCNEELEADWNKRIGDALDFVETATAENADQASQYEEDLQKLLDSFVDRSQLKSRYDELSAKQEEIYTPETWAPFAEAMKAAKAALEDTAATQEQVDEALQQLNDTAGKLEACLTGIAFEQDKVSLIKGQTAVLKVLPKPEEAKLPKIRYYSGSSNIATVDENGVVTGRGAGSTIIVATTEDENEFYAICEVTVTEDSKPGPDPDPTPVPTPAPTPVVTPAPTAKATAKPVLPTQTEEPEPEETEEPSESTPPESTPTPETPEATEAPEEIGETETPASGTEQDSTPWLLYALLGVAACVAIVIVVVVVQRRRNS